MTKLLTPQYPVLQDTFNFEAMYGALQADRLYGPAGMDLEDSGTRFRRTLTTPDLSFPAGSPTRIVDMAAAFQDPQQLAAAAAAGTFRPEMYAAAYVGVLIFSCDPALRFSGGKKA